MGIDELQIGNIFVYRADGGGAGGWFVDEKGNRVANVDYAFAEYGESE